jgi:hypothetical protein
MRRILEVPALRAGYDAELTRVLDEAWDLSVLLARIDEAEAAIAALPPSEDRDAFLAAVGGFRHTVVDRWAYLRFWMSR